MDDLGLDLEPALAAPRPRRRPTLAIIATGDRLCGVAAYAAALERHLAAAFEVTPIRLDQYLLRGRGRRLRRFGDAHIAAICRDLPRFDAVNLQLEHGTLGARPEDIYRRFGALLAAAPRLSVTFHTLPLPPPFPHAEFARAAARLAWRHAVRLWLEHRHARLLSAALPRRLRRAQRQKPVSAIVHTPRNRRDARYVYGLDHVFDHPLAFLSAEEAAAVRRRASRRNFPLLETLPEHAVLVGVFGFIGHYKGFHTVIRALRQLPDDYHLLIFGGVHPNEIGRHPQRHAYLTTLFDEAETGTTLYDRLADKPQITLDAARGLGELFAASPRDLSARIHFMGVLGDDEFLAGMASCDAVVFPYLEVGQSASGPLAQAVELGCRVIASRSHAFLGFAEYHRAAVEFFDIGNHLELATRLRARRQYPPRDGLAAYNIETNRAVYAAANGPLTPGPAPRVPARAAPVR